MVIVLGALFPTVDQRRLVPFVLPEMELPVGFVSILTTLEQPLGLGFLAGLHPLRDDVGEPALADHLQNVLTIELPVHQHIIDVDEALSRVK